MSFNVNAAPPSESEGNFQFLGPGIYQNGSLEKVVLEPQKLKDGSEVEVLAFYMKNAEGETHRHIEFTPGPDTKEEQVLNKIARIKHIIRCFNPEEITAIETDQKQLNFETFTDLGNWAITSIGNANETIKVDFKILGNVPTSGNNAGKPIASFPGYVGFMCVSGEGSLTFGNKEKIQNNTYNAALNAGNAADDDSSLTGGKPQQGAGGWGQQ